MELFLAIETFMEEVKFRGKASYKIFMHKSGKNNVLKSSIYSTKLTKKLNGFVPLTRKLN